MVSFKAAQNVWVDFIPATLKKLRLDQYFNVIVVVVVVVVVAVPVAVLALSGGSCEISDGYRVAPCSSACAPTTDSHCSDHSLL